MRVNVSSYPTEWEVKCCKRSMKVISEWRNVVPERGPSYIGQQCPMTSMRWLQNARPVWSTGGRISGNRSLHIKCHCYQGKSLIVDYFSKYPEVCLLQGKSASAVSSHFRTVFARHGLPEILVAENMPFDSSEMIKFAAEYGFTFNTSSPEHAAPNGQSENGQTTYAKGKWG